jgi:hypothetical protein
VKKYRNDGSIVGVFFYSATVRFSATYTPAIVALLEELALISDWYDTQKKN